MSRRWLRWLVAVAGVVAGGAAMFGFVHADQLRAVADAVRNRDLPVDVRRNVAYVTRNGTALAADIYRPGDAKAVHPAIVMLHGGAWRSGSKEQVADVAMPIARMGFVVVAPNYRLAPQHLWPAQIDDARSAVRWTRENAARIGADPKRIAAIGFSAGAHLAALLGTSGEVDSTSSVQAVVAISGPYDLDRWAAQPDAVYFTFLFGGTYRQRPQAYRDAAPTLHVTSHTPPFLLIHGAEDQLVLPSNDALLAAALRKHGVEVEVLEVKNAGHVLVPVEGKRPSPSVPEIFIRTAAFLNRHLDR